MIQQYAPNVSEIYVGESRVDKSLDIISQISDYDNDLVPDAQDCAPMDPTRQDAKHFKSKQAYQNWLAYGHMRNKEGKLKKKGEKSLFEATPGSQEIYIKGEKQKVKHPTC